ncbi:hypothetical protein pb186bvf_017861 [Paramecium bursaria]
MLIYLFFATVLAQEIGLPSEYEQILEQISKDDFGKGLIGLLQEQYKAQNDDSIANIDQLLHNLEQNIMESEKQDAEVLSLQSDDSSTQTEQLKQQVAEAQYDVTNLGSQIKSIKDQTSRFDQRIKERENIIEEYEDIQAQLDALRKKERVQFEKQRKSSTTISSLIKRSRYLIKQLIPKKFALVQQSSNDIASDEEINEQIIELQNEAKEYLSEDDGYVQLMNQFIQVSTLLKTEMETDTDAPASKQKVNAMLDILQRLYDQVDKTSTVQLNAEDDREKQFKKVIQQMNNDKQALKAQIVEMDQVIGDKREYIEQLTTAQKDAQARLTSLQKQQKDLQKIRDDEKVSYNQRVKERKQSLKLLRQARNVLNQNFEAAKAYIMNML